MCEALIFLFDNINIKFGTQLCSQIVGILIDTNCAPIVADLFLFCYERDFMIHVSLSGDKESEITEAFNSTSRNLNDQLYINNTYFDRMVNQAYPSDLHLNKAHSSDTKASFLGVHLPISEGFVSS